MIIALDESGTHGEDFLVIGILVVPSPGPLIQRLVEIKEKHKYYNVSGKHSAKYKEIHYKEIHTQRDRGVAIEWIDSPAPWFCWTPDKRVDSRSKEVST